MQIKNIWLNSKNTRGTNVEKMGKFNREIWIRMCECNLKNPNLGSFLKKRGKERIWACSENCNSWIWVCLKSVGLKFFFYFRENQLFLELCVFLLRTSCPPPLRLQSLLKGGACPRPFNQARGALPHCPPLDARLSYFKFFLDKKTSKHLG